MNKLENVKNWYRLVSVSALVAVAPPAWAQEGESGGSQEAGNALNIEPLLPEEGLLQSSTWVALFERLLANTVDYVPRALGALVILIVFWGLSRLCARLVRGVLQRTASDPALGEILSKVVRYGILVLGTVMAISQAGIAVGPLLASVSVLGLAVGLAAQDALSNLVAGFTILWDRPFRIGDRVTVSDTYGEVTAISIRTTTVRTLEQRELIIPNKNVIDDVIVNHSRTPDLRISIPVGIGYAEDPREARDVLLKVASSNEYVDQKEESRVVVTELADSSVNLELRVWLRDPKTERRAVFELMEQVKLALDEAAIEIPFPQRVLHLESAPAALHLADQPRQSMEAVS